MYRIFIVEDDAAIASTLARQIQMWGYEVRCAEHFQDILSEFQSFDPQLVLLDLMLPFYNGYHWCSEIRKISRVPILFLSSASDNMNIVMAMNMGGDDFIAKPFDLNVLTAKIQAILRRTYDFAKAQEALECRGAVLNTADASLTYQGQRLELTKNDYRRQCCLQEVQRQVDSSSQYTGAATASQIIRPWQRRCVAVSPLR